MLHLKWANYIARIWKLSLQAVIDFEDIELHGLNNDGTIHWTTEEFPDDIVEILCKEEDNDTTIVYYDEPEDTDEDEDNEWNTFHVLFNIIVV